MNICVHADVHARTHSGRHACTHACTITHTNNTYITYKHTHIHRHMHIHIHTRCLRHTLTSLRPQTNYLANKQQYNHTIPRMSGFPPPHTHTPPTPSKLLRVFTVNLGINAMHLTTSIRWTKHYVQDVKSMPLKAHSSLDINAYDAP